MNKIIVTADKLNKRRIVPDKLPDKESIIGVVNKGYTFEGEEIVNVPNPALGKWFKDRDNNFYWGGGLMIVEEEIDEKSAELIAGDNSLRESFTITPLIKRKIVRVINAFETGSADGNYGELVKYADYNDPETNTRIVQVTYGRSQTTEFGHLKALVQDYVERAGIYSEELKPYLNKIGKKPSLATENIFCNSLINAGTNDPIMKSCQDQLFDTKYYQPAIQWFTENGFRLPLSLLVIYDSTIHSGGILSFLRKRFAAVVPVRGGNEKEWIDSYVDVRHNWLANHTDKLLQNTIYRTQCLKDQISEENWALLKEFKANGILII